RGSQRGAGWPGLQLSSHHLGRTGSLWSRFGTVQGTKKLHQFVPFTVTEDDRPESRVEVRVGNAAAGIVRNHFLERGEAAVVHVWRGARHIAEARRPKTPTVVRFARHVIAAEVGEIAVPPDTHIMKLTVREEGPVVAKYMTRNTSRAAAEELPSSHSRSAHARDVAVEIVAVERGVAGDERPFVCRDGPADEREC